jgi:hypothetical protein
MFEDFASEVKYLIDIASKVREQKQKSKVTWNLSTDSVKRGVQMFRSRILKRIDEIEEKVDGFTADIVMIGTVEIKNHIFVIRTELIQLKRFIS